MSSSCIGIAYLCHACLHAQISTGGGLRASGERASRGASRSFFRLCATSLLLLSICAAAHAAQRLRQAPIPSGEIRSDAPRYNPIRSNTIRLGLPCDADRLCYHEMDAKKCDSKRPKVLPYLAGICVAPRRICIASASLLPRTDFRTERYSTQIGVLLMVAAGGSFSWCYPYFTFRISFWIFLIVWAFNSEPRHSYVAF